MDMHEFQQEVVRINTEKGWRDGQEISVGDALALITSEIGEAVDAYRRWGLDPIITEGGKPEGIGSELADIVIRTFDMADRFGLNLIDEIEQKLRYNETRPYRHGGWLM